MAEKSTSRFLHSIDKFARKKKLKLAEEIKQIEAESFKKEERKIIENARLLMMLELANVKNKIAMQVYKVRISSKQRIFDLKNKIQKKIFDACELRIKNFTESPEYVKYIENAIKKAEQKLGDNLKIYLRKQDLDLLNFMKNITAEHDIKPSLKIKKGGILCFKNNCVLDFTFDSRILEQKKWFLKNCISKLV